MSMASKAKVVIVGGSFGGLTTAYALRGYAGSEQIDITLVSKERRFTFIPSLIWVAIGSRSVERISFDLEHPLESKQVRFVNDAVTTIDTSRKMVLGTRGEHPYDFLVVATGHRSANEAVDGLGPFDGPGHSPMSPPEAEELASAIRALLRDPGPVVIGAAPGASCIGPAYELVFELDHLLRRRRIRHLAPLSFVTPEPYLGHMGMGGAGAVRQLLERAFEEREIPYATSASVTRVTTDAVEVDATRSIPSALSIIIPPLAGIEAVANSVGLANPKGFIPVGTGFRHQNAHGVYAVGVAVAMAPVSETPAPVNFPKTGHMTEQMATIAASDIASVVSGRRGRGEPEAELSARCVLSMGDRGIYMSVDPVRPPRNKIPTISEGRAWMVVKQLFERSYLWHARHGRRMPTALGW